ncbi:anti-sigma factor antagonist [bacterium]|nr:anti-sigma factor antagonist [bacterium]
MVIEFSVGVETSGVVPVVRVAGEIDVYTCPKLHKVLSEVVGSGQNKVVLDLQNVHYIDSTGLGTIAHSARTLLKSEGHLNVVCSRPQVRKVFEISGLSSKNVTLFEDEGLAFSS